MKTEFKEEQQFRQWWVWLLLLSIGSLPITAYYFKFESNKPMTKDDVIVFVPLYILFLLFFFFLKLKTNINKDTVSLIFFPLYKKSVKWTDIKSAEVLNYGFVGGYGIRLWTKYGTVYNTSGKIGLAITLNSGDKFLIGTHKEEELKAIIQNIKSLHE